MDETTKAFIRTIDVAGQRCYLAGDAATLLHVHRKTITRRCTSGRLTKIEYLGHVCIPAAEIDAQVKENKNEQA